MSALDPPQDIAAEQALIGSMLISEEALRAAAEVVQASDFYRPQHQTIFEAMQELWTHGERVDSISVLAQLTKMGKAQRCGGGPYLHTLMASVPSPAGAGYYADLVAERAGQRGLVEAGQRITQMAGQGTATLADVAAYARDQIAAVADSRVGVNHLTTPIEQFLTQTPEKPDWVIKDFLARGDRVVVTGKGGTGKSTFGRQIQVCGAAGIDPFNSRRVNPIKVSVIDKENSDYQNGHNYRPLLNLAAACTDGEGVNGRLSISGLSGRLDLLNPRDALSVLRTVEREKPDLVYVGPYYKLRGGADPDKEETVLKFTHVLDQIRDMGACTWTEAHPNKGANNGGDLAPSGSGVWNWWPEFGLGLRQDPDALTYRRVIVERWRVDRTDAMWPEILEAGGPGFWPWVEGVPA